jgi:hypothetical protein
VLLIVSITGLVFLACGTAWLLTFLLESLSQPTRSLIMGGAASASAPAAGPIAATLAGAILWVPSWVMVTRRRTRHPATESRAAARAVYLYTVLLVSVVVLVPDAAVLVYRSVDRLLSPGSAAPLLPDQAALIASLCVGLLCATYHGWLLRQDRRLGRPTRLRAGSRVPEPVDAEGGATTVQLVLRMPAGTDVEATLARIGGTLDAGMTIDWDRSQVRGTAMGSASPAGVDPAGAASPPA